MQNLAPIDDPQDVPTQAGVDGVVVISPTTPPVPADIWINTSVPGVTGSSYVLRAGDQMQGPLLQAADPVDPMGTVTKQYADTYTAVNTWSLATDWVDKGAGTGQFLTKYAGMVTFEVYCGRATALAVTAGNAYQFGTLPVGWQAGRNFIVPAICMMAGVRQSCLVFTDAAGTLQVRFFNTGTIGTSDYLSANGTFRLT